MRRVFPFLLILILAPLSYVSAQSYSIPGTYGYLTYNNIGLAGEVMLDINVTLINLAPYPKFVIINPRYDFRILRSDNEFGYTYRVGNTIEGRISLYTVNHSLNYMVGFWIMPYETVKINFGINSNASYTVEMLNYNNPCGDIGHIDSVTFTNGTLSHIYVNIPPGEIDRLTCGVVSPQLLNYPKIMSIRSMLPFLDRYIKVLKVEGVVKFKVTNVPDENNSTFGVFFAIAPPILFSDAKTYDYYPNYTMTYSEYIKDFIWKFRGLEPPQERKKPEINVTSNIFHLTNSLISGVRVPSFAQKPRRRAGFDFPVWIVLMRKEIEITYHVSWTNSGR
ncbi:hypothetical protein [Thermococcus sp.]|uniref:hypothetical protein n=1 Tax=Thermococcus sp. TaxID=35749 RepID=UPI002624395A|nr:hypothetical protein [Thermococcus sp.]